MYKVRSSGTHHTSAVTSNQRYLHVTFALHRTSYYRNPPPRHISPIAHFAALHLLSGALWTVTLWIVANSNFVIKLVRQRVKAMCYILVKPAYFSRFVTIHSRYRQTMTDDRQHLMGIAELAMQLQRSAKNWLVQRDRVTLVPGGYNRFGAPADAIAAIDSGCPLCRTVIWFCICIVVLNIHGVP